MQLTEEEKYHELRPNVTGGLANSYHRFNEKDETHLSKQKLEGQYIVSNDLDYIMTHVCGHDLNSLYPSVMSGIPHDFIKYTGHRIYMPSFELVRIECQPEPQSDMNRADLIYYDTDSMMLAVAGDPKQNYQQGFSAEIIDKQIYDQNQYKFFPQPKQVITEENKSQPDKIDEDQ
ncbi:MAG: hypothetical protein EZS28_019592 [Streblomastix strix]|uniref:Uncharacterized protein n=1 Tax=Streblomastix strix TaxID=222440 RepID=A0A5J4VQU6_9EUKA|nr:MAG: hypothetical protein EZS28_019592 [Streblomastix strix]